MATAAIFMARAWESRTRAAYIIGAATLQDLHRKFTWLADIWGLSSLTSVLCFEREDIREILSRFVLGRPNPTPQDRDVSLRWRQRPVEEVHLFLTLFLFVVIFLVCVLCTS